MALVHPDRVVAAWLRSGVPLLEADEKRPTIKPHVLADGTLAVPIMCNPGTQEGVTVTDGRFKGVWPANQAFFKAIRSRSGLIGVAVDPKTAHECGNQRYLAIPWLDACLAARLPRADGATLEPMPTAEAWLAPIEGGTPVPAAKTGGDLLESGWLPNAAIARKWSQYVTDTAVASSKACNTATRPSFRSYRCVSSMRPHQLTRSIATKSSPSTRRDSNHRRAFWSGETDLDSAASLSIAQRTVRYFADFVLRSPARLPLMVLPCTREPVQAPVATRPLPRLAWMTFLAAG
jgi:hypothetical protein